MAESKGKAAVRTVSNKVVNELVQCYQANVNRLIRMKGVSFPDWLNVEALTRKYQSVDHQVYSTNCKSKSLCSGYRMKSHLEGDFKAEVHRQNIGPSPASFYLLRLSQHIH